MTCTRDRGTEILVSHGTNFQLGLKRGWSFTFNPMSVVSYQREYTNKGNKVYVAASSDGNVRLHQEFGFSWKTAGVTYKRIIDTGDDDGHLDGTYKSENYEISLNAFFVTLKWKWGSDGGSFGYGLSVGAGLGIGGIGGSAETWQGNTIKY